MNNRVEETIDYIRMEYIDGAKISELAEKYNVNINTLYSRRRREGWDLLRDKKIADIAKARHMMINAIKSKSLGFYTDTLDLCQQHLEGDLTPKELKVVVETRALAEDRLFLFAGEILKAELEEDTNKAEGLLDDIIGQF